jgi:hypothetical protein
MSKDLELKIGSTIYGKIMAARMSEHERRTALHAMHTADAIVEAIIAVKRGVEHLGARLFFKPSLKH